MADEVISEGLSADLVAIEKSMREEDARLAGIKEAAKKIALDRAANEKWERDNRRRKIKEWTQNILIGIVVLSVIGTLIYFIERWDDTNNRQEAIFWANWERECEKAGGDPVGQKTGLVCHFPSGAELHWENIASW